MKIFKGEAVLIKTNKNLDERYDFIRESFDLNEDIFILKSDDLAVDDIRYFQEYFNKKTHELNDDFKKLGILIFDNISIQAQNSLLKIL